MQKFQRGDLVMIAEDLGSHKSHFTSGCRAIVLGSYKDQFGGNDTDSYSIRIEKKGEVSWYEEHQLTLIESNRLDVLQQWEAEEQADYCQKNDLDWVFINGDEVIEHGYSASIEGLAACLGLDSCNLWGSHGEGFVYYQNALSILEKAKPFLSNGDKKGWLAFVKTMKENEVVTRR